MNNRPWMLRTAIAVIVILVFVCSMYPLTQRDFYDTFRKLLSDPKDPVAEQLIADAKAMQAKNPELFASQALLAATENKGVVLKDHLKDKSLSDNRDVMSRVRKDASSSIRLGLDLNGGVEFMLQLIPDQEFLDRLGSSEGAKDRSEVEERMTSEFNRYRDIAIEILRKRLEGQKIYEAEISPSGDRYVSIKAPIVAKDEKVKLLNLISMSAKLRFRLVHPENAALVNAYLENPDGFTAPIGYELLSTTEFRPGQKPLVQHYFVKYDWVMDGKGVRDAFPVRDQFGQRQISLSFNPEGAARFAQVTTENVGRQLAIVLDGKLYCAPNIKEPITGGNASISGSFSEEECKNISDALVSGSFPFQIKVDAVFDTDPKLGADNVSNGVWVALWSMAGVVVFMMAYYLVGGVISVIALIINLLLLLGAMAAFDATLTLPGIAGIVLTIGMAVDANVLIFERIREELKNGKSLIPAVDAGYSNALSAVIDSNLTTLITSIILMSVGTGAIKGFAVALSIGILSTLFTALFLTRLLFDFLFMLLPNMQTLKMNQFFTEAKIDFKKLWKICTPVSAALVLASLALFCVKNTSMLGVDFTGGTQVMFNYVKQIPASEMEKALAKINYQAVVTYKSSASAQDSRKVEILIREDMTQKSNSPKEVLQKYLNERFPEAQFSGGQESSVGGLIGWEFSKYAIIAIILSTLGIGAYVTLRYELNYAAASIIALLHDVIIVLGIYILMGRTISLSVVAAVLTTLGYSINDKVVVFDRVRENVRKDEKADYLTTVVGSINQTLSRTVLTSLTTLIVVVVLFIWGGIAINDFVLIMLLGIIVGTYSSMFVAAPAVVWLRSRKLHHTPVTDAKK